MPKIIHVDYPYLNTYLPWFILRPRYGRMASSVFAEKPDIIYVTNVTKDLYWHWECRKGYDCYFGGRHVQSSEDIDYAGTMTIVNHDFRILDAATISAEDGASISTIEVKEDPSRREEKKVFRLVTNNGPRDFLGPG